MYTELGLRWTVVVFGMSTYPVWYVVGLPS